MADLTEAQRKRAKARQQRRGGAQAGPSADAENESPPETSEEGEDALQSVKQAAKVAATGAAVGAAAAAAHALTSHRNEADDGEDGAAVEEEPSRRGEQAEGDREEPQAADHEAGDPGAAEAEREEEPHEEPQPVAGADATDARRTIDRAREQLEELLERRVESVSSLERTHDGWTVALEVVELSRIPESTDVLASYEMELDEQLNLRRYQQVRRYHRGRADRAEGS